MENVKIKTSNKVVNFLLKHKFKLFIIPVLILAVCLAVSGYLGNKVYNLSYLKLSEIRYNLYANNDEKLQVTFMSGKREKEYLINGYNTELVDFGVLTFKFIDESQISDTANYTYVLKIGQASYDGVLEQNPFDGSYVADIRRLVTSDEQMTATIKYGTKALSLDLNNISASWSVDYDAAFKIACKTLKNELEDFIENNEFVGECYVKLILDEDYNVGTYYWYVNFINRSGKTLSIIIDPISKEVLAKKTN